MTESTQLAGRLEPHPEILGYRPDIDVLRALSVAAVVAFHLFPAIFPLGYLGVDCFFVISGYLVTRIILNEMKGGAFSFGAFWARRIRRLQPAAVFLLSAVIAALIFLPLPYAITDSTFKHLIYVATFTSNIRCQKIAEDYWGADGERMPLLHTWSLSVEEQFYILLPVAIFLVHKIYPGHRRAAVFLATAALFSCGWSAWQVLHGQPVFYSLIMRVAQLGLGACLGALSMHEASGFASGAPKWVRPASWTFLALILLGPWASLLPAGMSFLPMLAAVLLASALVALPHAKSGHVTGWRKSFNDTLISLGKSSYSIYLWHWPVIVIASIYAKVISPGATYFVGGVVAISGATISYLIVEKKGRKVGKPFAFWATSTLLIVSLSAGAILTLSPSIDERLPRPSWHGNVFDIAAQTGPPHKIWSGVSVHVRDDKGPPLLSGYATRPDMPVGAMIFGDSHACMWAKLIDESMERRRMGTLSFASNGLGLFEEEQAGFSSHELARLRANGLLEAARHRPRFIVIASYWGNYTGRDEVEKLRKFMRALKEASPQSRILVLGDPPVIGIGNKIFTPDFLSFSSRLGADNPYVSAGYAPDSQLGQDEVARMCDEEKTEFLRINMLFSDKIRIIQDQSCLYIDDDHLSTEGSRLYGKGLATTLSQ